MAIRFTKGLEPELGEREGEEELVDGANRGKRGERWPLTSISLIPEMVPVSYPKRIL